MELKQITENEWLHRFKPQKNHLVRTPEMSIQHKGVVAEMFETYGEELAYVQSFPDNRVWTLIDTEEEPIITSGAHFVNRLGYFVTDIPCEEGVTYDVIED